MAVRMQFEFSDERATEIGRLQQQCGFATRKDMFNTALTLLKWAARHAEQGHAVGAISETDKQYWQLEMAFLTHVGDKSAQSQRG